MFENELEFISPPFGLIPITQPVGFDGEKFVAEREKGRYGLDITYGDPEISLVFWDIVGEESEIPYIPPSGQVIYFKTHALEKLLAAHKEKGFEMEVNRIIKRNGSQITVGMLDGLTAKTDGRTYFSCKVIQQSGRAKMKRDSGTKIDLLSDKDVNGYPIEPAELINVLLKAKPITAVSEWKQLDSNLLFAGFHEYFNVARSLKGKIDDSLIPFDAFDDLGWTDTTAINNFKYIRAKNDLSKITMEVDLDYTFYYRFISGSGFNPAAYIKGTVVVSSEPLVAPLYSSVFYKKEISNGINQDFTFNDKLIVDIPYCPKDYCISVYWSLSWDTGHLGTTDAEGSSFLDFLVSVGVIYGLGTLIAINNLETGTGGYHDRTAWMIRNQSMKITATQTAIDTVIKGVRYIDAFKQTAKSISGFEIDAPRFDVGGEYYNQILFDGWRIRQFTDKPFYCTWKDLTLGLQEVNADYQINKNNIFMGDYPDFYQNIEVGAFIEIPGEDFEESFDDDYTLKLFTSKYKKYEQFREEENTVDGVHTEYQKRFPNKLTETEREIEIPHIRDPFAIESATRQSIIAKPTTSLSTDDDLHLLDIIELAPGTFKTFGAKLLVRADTVAGTLTILNQSSEGESSFPWDLLGFGVGDAFEITGFSNAATYTVFAVDSSSITLTPTSIIIGGQIGDVYMTFKYYLTNVLYVNRTNEGFNLVENIDSGDNFSNLNYTPFYNGIKWQPFWDAVCEFQQDGTIRTTYFKNNGKLRTQKLSTDPIYQEDQDLLVSDLSQAFLRPVNYQTRFNANFDEVLQLMDDLELVRGFIRIQKSDGRIVKVHPKKFPYEWATENATPLVIERKEPNLFVITSIPNGVEINGAPYNTDKLYTEWFDINNGYLVIFDNKYIKIINPTIFTDVSINGVLYTDEILFNDALLGLI